MSDMSSLLFRCPIAVDEQPNCKHHRLKCRRFSVVVIGVDEVVTSNISITNNVKFGQEIEVAGRIEAVGAVEMVISSRCNTIRTCNRIHR